MRILGIDPGSERTGVALLEVTDTDSPTLIEFWDVPGGPEGFLEWWKQPPAHDVLVVENYIVRQGIPSNHRALETVGFLRGTRPDAIFQPPSGRKTAVPDATLKKLGLHLAGNKNRNAIEAVRHVVWWLVKTKHKPTLRAGWGG